MNCKVLSLCSLLLFSLFPPRYETGEFTPIYHGAPFETTVCTFGILPLELYQNGYYDFLPQGYLNPSSEEGSFTIGEKEETDLAPLRFKNTSEEYMTLLFSFETPLSSFPLNRAKDRIGYRLEYKKKGEEKKSVSAYIKASSLKNSFTFDPFTNTKILQTFSPLQSSLFYLPVSEMFALPFAIEEECTLYSLTFDYGDNPEPLKKVSLVKGKVLPTGIPTIQESYISSCNCSKSSYDQVLNDTMTCSLESNFGHPLNPEYLKTRFAIRDPNDALIFAYPDTLVDKDGYYRVGGNAALGSTFRLELSSSLYPDAGTVHLAITVVDKKAPTITKLQEEEIEASYTTDFLGEEFLQSHFHYYDNYDGEDIAFSLAEENGYAFNRFQMGKRNVLLKGEDSHGNTGSYPFSLSLYDDVPPLLESSKDEIHITSDTLYSEEDLLSFFEAEDEVDGTVEIVFQENSYSGKERQTGNYEIKALARDKAGNESEKTLYLSVVPKGAPTYYVKGSFLSFLQGQIPSKEELLTTLIRNGLLPDRSYTSLRTYEGEELDDRLKPGTYDITLEAISEEGESNYCDLTIEILPKESKKEEETESGGFFARIVAFFKKLFEAILSFFRRLFSLS